MAWVAVSVAMEPPSKAWGDGTDSAIAHYSLWGRGTPALRAGGAVRRGRQRRARKRVRLTPVRVRHMLFAIAMADAYVQLGWKKTRRKGGLLDFKTLGNISACRVAGGGRARRRLQGRRQRQGQQGGRGRHPGGDRRLHRQGRRRL